MLWDFISLADLGYSEYEINRDGLVWSLRSQKLLTLGERRGSPGSYFYMLRRDHDHTQVLAVPLAVLMSEMFWSEEPITECMERYRKEIESAREFYLTPANNIRRISSEITKNQRNYWVTSHGDVWYDYPKSKMAPYVNKIGYLHVGFHGKDGTTHMRVHRLVAMHFCPIPDRLKKLGLGFNDLQVNHIDGNKLNNRASNLEWCTQQENMIHAYDTGLNKGPRKHDEQVYDAIGRMLQDGIGIAEISQKLNVSRNTVSYIKRGLSSRLSAELASKYTWEPPKNKLLPEDNVREILERYFKKHQTRQTIAKELGVTCDRVRYVVSGRAHRDLFLQYGGVTEAERELTNLRRNWDVLRLSTEISDRAEIGKRCGLSESAASAMICGSIRPKLHAEFHRRNAAGLTLDITDEELSLLK